MSQPYSDDFYRRQQAGSSRSAQRIVPLFLSLFPATSVVDIGCGVGGWLEVFAAHGVADHLGVDGDYVPLDMLRFAHDRFRQADLSKHLDLGRRFDAAVCLEVAEHLSPDAADGLVKTLTDAAPVVLFSAAIPRQGGIGHLNEQWPSFWAERFAARGYVALDPIRPEIRWDGTVEFWYRQNVVVFCRPERVPAGLRHATAYDLDRVDLELYLYLRAVLDEHRTPKGS